MCLNQNVANNTSGINFGVTFIGLYLIEHYGRRKSLMAGSAWMYALPSPLSPPHPC